jgi:hypothetical protein
MVVEDVTASQSASWRLAVLSATLQMQRYEAAAWLLLLRMTLLCTGIRVHEGHTRSCGITLHLGVACMQGPAGRDAAAEAAPPEPGSQLGPVFVPIVLAMDEDTHGPLLDEWLARQRVRSWSYGKEDLACLCQCVSACLPGILADVHRSKLMYVCTVCPGVAWVLQRCRGSGARASAAKPLLCIPGGSRMPCSDCKTLAVVWACQASGHCGIIAQLRMGRCHVIHVLQQHHRLLHVADTNAQS